MNIRILFISNRFIGSVALWLQELAESSEEAVVDYVEKIVDSNNQLTNMEFHFVIIYKKPDSKNAIINIDDFKNPLVGMRWLKINDALMKSAEKLLKI